MWYLIMLAFCTCSLQELLITKNLIPLGVAHVSGNLPSAALSARRDLPAPRYRCRRRHAGLQPPRQPAQALSGKADHLRVRHHPLHGCAPEVLHPLLPHRHAVPDLRYRSRLSLSLGRRVRQHRPQRLHRYGHLHYYTPRRVCVRLEEGSTGVGIINNVFEEGYITTRVDELLNYMRSCSIWPMTFGLACC